MHKARRLSLITWFTIASAVGSAFSLGHEEFRHASLGAWPDAWQRSTTEAAPQSLGTQALGVLQAMVAAPTLLSSDARATLETTKATEITLVASARR